MAAFDAELDELRRRYFEWLHGEMVKGAPETSLVTYIQWLEAEVLQAHQNFNRYRAQVRAGAHIDALQAIDDWCAAHSLPTPSQLATGKPD